MTSSSPPVLISHAIVLTMDDALGDLPDGDVLIDNGRIAQVGVGIEAPPGASLIDGHGRIVIPGFVDTHRHMYQAVLRGMAPRHTFDDYFQDVLGVVVPCLTPDDLRLGEMLSARAALLSGVTTVQDVSNIQESPQHTDAILDGLVHSGIRAVFGYGLGSSTVMTGRGQLPGDTRRIRDRLGDNGLVTMALIAEQSDDDVELANATLARDLDVRVARHVSAGSPVSRLAAIGALRPGTTFIHANGLSSNEFHCIADHGGSVSVAAAIEMTMGHGYPVLADLPPDVLATLSTDVEVTVASDMFTQMRAAYASARTKQLVMENANRDITVRDVLRAATRDGAESLGLGDRIGSLTPGKAADVVMLRADRADVAPVIDPYSTVVMQMDRAHIDTVMVGGRIVSVTDDSPLLDAADAVVERLRGKSVLPTLAHIGSAALPGRTHDDLVDVDIGGLVDHPRHRVRNGLRG